MRLYSKRRRQITKIFLATTILVAGIFFVGDFIMKESKRVVIAKVNDQKIYEDEVKRKLQLIFRSQNQDGNVKIENLPKQVLELVIKEIYTEKELTEMAEKSKVTKTEEVKNLINESRGNILRQIYIDDLIASTVNDQLINEKYLEITNDFSGEKEYMIAHIVVGSKKDALEIAKKLKAGKNSDKTFFSLAEKYSTDENSAKKGGNLGYFLEENLIKELAKPVTELPVGGVSEPIETSHGWHIVKLLAVRDAVAPTFESIKDEIRQQLINEEIRKINSKVTENSEIKILVKLQKPDAKLEKIDLNKDAKPQKKTKPESK